MEEMTEIIQRLRAVTLLANNDVGPEPVQSAFVVKISPRRQECQASGAK